MNQSTKADRLQSLVLRGIWQKRID